MCVCVCVRERERVSVCVCVLLREGVECIVGDMSPIEIQAAQMG